MHLIEDCFSIETEAIEFVYNVNPKWNNFKINDNFYLKNI